MEEEGFRRSGFRQCLEFNLVIYLHFLHNCKETYTYSSTLFIIEDSPVASYSRLVLRARSMHNTTKIILGITSYGVLYNFVLYSILLVVICILLSKYSSNYA